MKKQIKIFLNIFIYIVALIILSGCINTEDSNESNYKIEENTYKEDLKNVIEITNELNKMYFSNEGFSDMTSYENYIEKDIFIKEDRVFTFLEKDYLETFEDYLSSEDIYSVIYLNYAVKDFSHYYDNPLFEEGNIIIVFDIDKKSKKIINYNVYN